MRRTTLFLASFTVLFLYLTLWTWGKLNISPKTETHLRLTLDDRVGSLDPATAFSDDSLLVISQVLEPLYQYHYLKRPYEIQPLIADGLPVITNGGLQVKIKIKKHVYFHKHEAWGDTKRELVAEDFVNQIKRIALKNSKSPGYGLFSGLIKGFTEYDSKVGSQWQKIFANTLEGFIADGRYSLKITLNRKEPNLIYYLALNFLSPMPAELITFYDNNFDNHIIGTGPYFIRQTGSNFIDLEKNSNYRTDYYPTVGDRYANLKKLLASGQEKIPFVDKVRFYHTKDESERWEMFFNQDVDLMTVPKSFLPNLFNKDRDVSDILKRKDVVLKHFPTLANRWLAFNMTDPILGKNLHLRKSIAHGIDYQKYIEIISQNTNLRSNSILVPGISGYSPAKEFRYEYSPTLAKEYLKKAGYDPRSKRPFIKYSTRSNQMVSQLEANFIKEQLEKIGFNVEIEILSFAEFLKKGRAGELMFFTDNWLFDYPEAENILQLLASYNSPGINKSGYSNPEVDFLYTKLKQELNLERREIISHQIEQIVFQDLPWIPLMFESSYVVHYPKIKNYRKSSIIRNYIKYLKVEN